MGGASPGDGHHHQAVSWGLSLFRDILLMLTLMLTLIAAVLRNDRQDKSRSGPAHSRAEPVACVLAIPRSPCHWPRHDHGQKMMIVNLL